MVDAVGKLGRLEAWGAGIVLSWAMRSSGSMD